MSGGHDICIFDHSQISEGASKLDSDPGIQVAHSDDVFMFRFSCNFISSSESPRLVYCNEDGIYGYKPGSATVLREPEPEISLLFKWPLLFLPSSSVTTHLSHNYGVLEDSGSLFFVRYFWPEEHNGLSAGISQRGFPGLGSTFSIQISPVSR